MSEFPNTAKGWADTTAGSACWAAERARSYAPKTYDGSVQAANYVSGSIREHPWSASAILPVLGYIVGFLLHHEWSDAGTAKYRSRTDAAANTAQSAADVVRSDADRTCSAGTKSHDRAAKAVNSVGGAGLFSLLVAAAVGLALGAVDWKRVQPDDRNLPKDVPASDRDRQREIAARAGGIAPQSP
jgi:ElaB/YqjD/DUF883 family membrane-anchored ribosome-binding protein